MTRGAIEVFIDTIILELPISIVVLFQLSLNRNVSSVVIFLLGSLWVCLIRVQSPCLLMDITVSS